MKTLEETPNLVLIPDKVSGEGIYLITYFEKWEKSVMGELVAQVVDTGLRKQRKKLFFNARKKGAAMWAPPDSAIFVMNGEVI